MKVNAISGFTINEILVTMVIAGVIALLLFLGMNRLIQDNRMTTRVNNLVGNFMVARDQALTKNRMVSVCASNDQTTCSGDTNWDNGYIVFVNNDEDNPPVVDAGEEILRMEGDIPNNMTIRSAAFAGVVSFTHVAITNAPGTFTICDGRANTFARGVLVSGIGRARVSQDKDNDGVHEDNLNMDLACP